MKRTPLLCLLFLAGAVGACSDSGESPPPSSSKVKETTSFSDVAVNPRASWATATQRDQVTIQDDRLIFPAKGNEGLLKKVAGDVLVSDRGKKGNNPFGYMRKVVSVSQQESSIVVMTEHATLDEVLVGHFEIVAQPEDLALMTEQERGELGAPSGTSSGEPLAAPGLQPQGEQELGLTLAKEVKDVKLFEVKTPKVKIPIGGKQLDGTIGGALKVGRAGFSFRPSVRIGAEIETPDGFWDKFSASNYVKEFHTRAKGEISTSMVLVGNLTAALEIPDIYKKDKSNSADLASIAEKMASQFKSLNPPTKVSATLAKIPFVGPPLPTPVGPIPITYEFDIELVCAAQFAGGFEWEWGYEGSSTAEFGVVYEKDKGWRPESNFDMKFTQIGPNRKFNGSAEFKCALEPKLATHLADAAGPFLKVSASASVKAEYKEECPKGAMDVKPTPALGLGFEAGLDVFIGADVQIPILKYKIAEAQFTLFNKTLLKVESPKLGIPLPPNWILGWCTAGEPCGDPATDPDTQSSPYCQNAGGAGGAGGAGSGGTSNQGGNGSGATNQGGNGSGASNSGGNGTGATSQGGNGSGTSGQGGSGQTAVCGNGKVDSAIEFCDGNDFDGKTCADYKGNPNATGPLKCNQDCTIDTSSCDVGAVCGDVCKPATTPQKPECGGCQQKVCAANEYCCNDKWDAVCVSVAKTLCGTCN